MFSACLRFKCFIFFFRFSAVCFKLLCIRSQRATMVGSIAFFRSRCHATGLTEAAITALTNKGWKTSGTFASCASNFPATVTGTIFAEKVVQQISGNREHVDAPKLGRLHFEAYTTESAELKRRVDSSEQDAPHKLQPQKISERLEVLQKKGFPLRLENAVEPSHSLINRVAQFVEEGRLKYLEWSKCTTRDQEVNNSKEDQFLQLWKPDASGAIKAVDKSSDVRGAISSDLEVHNALRSKGVAYDGAQVAAAEREAPVNQGGEGCSRQLTAGQAVALRGGAPANSDGKPIGFGYDLGTCKCGGDGQRGHIVDVTRSAF